MSELTQNTDRGAAEIAQEINQIKAQVLETALRGAIEIGKRLHEAKALVPFGSWGRWLEDNVDYSERKAQELMALADEYGRKETRALAEIQNKTQAVLLMALSEREREQFVQENDMSTISTRELEEKIRQLQEENEKKQLTIDELMGISSQPAEDARPMAVVDEDELEAMRRSLEETREALTDAEKSLQAARQQAANAEERREEEVKRERERTTEAKNACGKAERELLDAIAAAKKAESKAEAQDKQLKRMEEELKAARAEVRTVEVIPQDVEKELERLRAQASRSGAESDMRAAFDGLKAAFERLTGVVEDAESTDPEVAVKYKAAFYKAMLTMAERMK